MTILKYFRKNNAPRFKSYTVKLYNREVDTAVKWVSTYLLRAKHSLYVANKTKVSKSAKVCICGSNVLVVYLF